MKKNRIFSRLRYWTSVATIGVILGFSLQFVRAWTEPTSAPPTGNVGAPLTTGALGQSKSGNMFISTIDGVANGLIVAFGKVGIGTWDPGAKLEVAGQVKITDGLQGAGKVLTSDDTGLASWQAPSGGALPVGSVYLSVVSTNPNSLLGYGTWVQIAKGRALIGQDPADADWDVAEETRGEKLHTLTQAEMPSHYHTVDPPYANTGTVSSDHAHYVSGNTNGISANHKHGPNDGSTGAVEFLSTKVSGTGNYQRPSGGNNAVNNPTTGYVSSDHGHWWGAWTGGINANHYHGVDIGQFNSGSIGSGSAFNNIQPSFVIFVWKRTS